MVVLKLLLTPALIILASAAQRRWGSSLAGLIVGLPLTAAPVNLFLAVEQGQAFAAQAAAGTLLGLVPLAGFCVAYAWAARRCGVLHASLAGFVAYAIFVVTGARITLSAVVAFPIVVGVLCVALAATWHPRRAPSPRATSSGEIVLRALVATIVVVVITGLARVLGPWRSGLLTPFPVFAGTLAIFTHRSQGAQAAAAFLRGVLLGSFAYALFFLVVGMTIEQAGTVLAFLVALVASLASQVPIVFSRFSEAPRAPRAQ